MSKAREFIEACGPFHQRHWGCCMSRAILRPPGVQFQQHFSSSFKLESVNSGFFSNLRLVFAFFPIFYVSNYPNHMIHLLFYKFILSWDYYKTKRCVETGLMRLQSKQFLMPPSLRSCEHLYNLVLHSSEVKVITFNWFAGRDVFRRHFLKSYDKERNLRKSIFIPGVSNSNQLEGNILAKNVPRAAVYKKMLLRASKYKKSPQNELNLIKLYTFVIFWGVRGPHQCTRLATCGPRAACLRTLIYTIWNILNLYFLATTKAVPNDFCFYIILINFVICFWKPWL